MEMLVPSTLTGGTTACTRIPSTRRTSANGMATSMCRPPRSMSSRARARCSISPKVHDSTRRKPSTEHTHAPRGPMAISVTPGEFARLSSCSTISRTRHGATPASNPRVTQTSQGKRKRRHKLGGTVSPATRRWGNERAGVRRNRRDAHNPKRAIT